MKPLQTCLLAASAILALNGNASIYRIVSPSGTVTAEIINDGDLSWRVSHDGKEVLSKSPISMTHLRLRSLLDMEHAYPSTTWSRPDCRGKVRDNPGGQSR